MLLGILGASLLESLNRQRHIYAGKWVNKIGKGIHRAGEGIVKAGEGNKIDF